MLVFSLIFGFWFHPHSCGESLLVVFANALNMQRLKDFSSCNQDFLADF